MYYYIVREVLPELVILGAGFVLLGLVIAAPVVIWKGAKLLAQGFRTSGSQFAFLVARWRERTSGASVRPRLVPASIAAARERRS